MLFFKISGWSLNGIESGICGRIGTAGRAVSGRLAVRLKAFFPGFDGFPGEKPGKMSSFSDFNLQLPEKGVY
jgi:hypothetical protein